MCIQCVVHVVLLVANTHKLVMGTMCAVRSHLYDLSDAIAE